MFKYFERVHDFTVVFNFIPLSIPIRKLTINIDIKKLKRLIYQNLCKKWVENYLNKIKIFPDFED
jgi:hypothetical protein